jgi:hypothetical protein
LLLIDWRWLREHDRLQAYTEALGDSRSLLDAAASEWIPHAVGRRHWEAIHAIQLSREQLVAMGTFMGERANNVVLATLVRLAGKLGASPWPALGQCYKLWTRSWRGGGVAAYRHGEHSARLEVFGASTFALRCFRTGIIGTITVGLAAFCREPVVVERADARTATSISLRVSWQPQITAR